MPQVNIKLAEGQTLTITVGEITVTETGATQYVSDEELAALEEDDRVSVERIGEESSTS